VEFYALEVKLWKAFKNEDCMGSNREISTEEARSVETLLGLDWPQMTWNSFGVGSR
jgi:hypothetical protein